MEHSCECRYKDTDKLMYALLEMEDHMILISAIEMGLFGKYLDFALNDDEGVCIDYEQPDNCAYKIVYGGLFLGSNEKELTEGIVKYIDDLKGFALLDIEEERVNVSGYDDIVLYPEKAVAKNFIPFAALMKTPHELKEEVCSVTIFPTAQGITVWESMVNRAFLLACRETVSLPGLTLESWRDHIEEDAMMAAYMVADLVTD